MVARSCASILLALVLAACGAGTPTTAPTSAGATAAVTAAPPFAPPTAEPTAAPDVARLYAAKGRQLTSGTLQYSGTLQDPSPWAAGPLSGTAEWDAATNQTLVSTTGPEATMSVETLIAGGKTYLRRNGGPWVAAPSGVASPLVTQLQATLAVTFTDTGTEVRNGQTLHKLSPTTTVAFDPATLIPDAAPIAGGTTTLTVYAAEDGSAVLATVAVAFAGNQLNAEFTFASLGTGGPLTAPAADDVWPTFTSTRWDASIAHPKGWKYEKGSDYDAWLSSGFPFFSFGRDSVSADAQAEATKEFNRQKSFYGGSKGTMADAVLDGVAGHFIKVTGHDSYYGANVVVYEVIAQVGKKLYWIFWESKQGNEAKDLATFQDIVSTFRFVP